jgi:hypothetical protein
MQLSLDGAQLFAAAFNSDDLLHLEHSLEGVTLDRPGNRLSGIPALARLLAPTGSIGRSAAAHLGQRAKPVRALLFNKTMAHNWALGWHQDRTIVVRQRHDLSGFGNWTVKAGMLHVEPPFEILERMITLRLHLDDVGPRNAPLLISPGSHALGRIPEASIERAIERLGTFACLADRGDVWLYSTPILHASEAAATPGGRRVLQVDYSADLLPEPLEWLGV